jgi:polyisoprenoid-binding protein YceI
MVSFGIIGKSRNAKVSERLVRFSPSLNNLSLIRLRFYLSDYLTLINLTKFKVLTIVVYTIIVHIFATSNNKTMKNLLTTFAIMSATLAQTTQTAEAQQVWNFDNTHTKVEFNVTHLVISEVTGNFKTWSGKVVSSNDDFTDATIEFSIDVATVNTDNEMRDNHLKGDDFFNAEKFPKMTFKSKSFKKVSGKNYKLVGDLTIRDVTKQVEFDVVYNGQAKDPWGNTKAGFKLKGEINRFDYNLKWNVLAEAGAVVSKEVEIIANVQLVKEAK